MIPFRKTFENFACPPGGYTKIEICTIRHCRVSTYVPWSIERVTEMSQCAVDYNMEHLVGQVRVGIFGSISNEDPRLLFISDTPECAIEALMMLGVIAPLPAEHEDRKTLGRHVSVAERVDPDTHRIVAAFNRPPQVSTRRFTLAVEIVKCLLSPTAEVIERQDLPDTLSDILPNTTDATSIAPEDQQH